MMTSDFQVKVKIPVTSKVPHVSHPYPMPKRGGQIEQPDGICRRLIDFIMGSLIVRSFSRLAFIFQAPPTRMSNQPVSASAGPNAYSLLGHDPATATDSTKQVGTRFEKDNEFDLQTEILVDQGGSSSRRGVRKRHKKPVMSPGGDAATQPQPDHHEAKLKHPVHFRPHFLDVESNINEKTDEFIKRRKAAMRQTDSIEAMFGRNTS
uniref:Uncharacterized protein n=1 Tax=Kalanchoe fedtschenkoi TaxID=63787 RepID=A0A7N0ZYP3_KALFE